MMAAPTPATVAGESKIVFCGRCVDAVTGKPLAGVMAAAIWPLRQMFPLLPITLGAVVYFLVLLLLSTFNDDEKDAFRRLRASAVGRMSRRRTTDAQGIG